MAASSREGQIKPIDRTAIHRICSGQVVLGLATAVKELVENSLDAGATNVEIRLKDHGAELIEVSDNGTGVSPDNYQGLTLKYHTSKISNFADLQSLSSFGFRGEALSSLCALAKVSIITRTKNEPIAVRLDYDHSGVIVSQENVARPVGTTVSVEKLFSPLPVRFKEFRRENSLRREYGKLLSVLQAYALIAKGVRINCSHQAGKAGRTVVVQTQGNTSMRDNLVTIFGTKTASCMERVDLNISDTCSVEGFLSKPGAGCGRPSGDRQFFYVNGRPVDLPKVAKLLNELYRSFNSLQYPMAVLNFTLPTTAYDVNVTPDKRKLFLHSENELLAALRESLETMYTPTKYSYTINSLENGRLSQKGMSSDKKVGRSSQSAGSLLQSDALTDACYDEDEAEKEPNVSPTSEGAVETETSLSDRVPLSLLAFQDKVTNRSTEQGSSGTAETGSASSVSREINQSNVQSEKRVQPALVPCASRAKRPVDESHGVLSEVPLLKRWRRLGGKTEDGDEIEEVHGMDENEGGVSNVPNGIDLQTYTGCKEKRSTEEDEIISPPVGVKDVSTIPSDKASGKLRKMVPCSNGKLEKRPAFKSLSQSEAENVTLELRRKVVEARHCLEPGMCAEAAEANVGNVNQLQRKSLAVSLNFATEVDRERKVAKTEAVGEDPIQANVHKLTQVQQERISALIRSKSKVDAETEVAEAEHMANLPQERPVIQFDMEKARRRLQLCSLQGQKNSSSRQRMPRRKRYFRNSQLVFGTRQKENSCLFVAPLIPPVSNSFAAATLNAVGKDDTEKEAVLNAATKELERSFNKADFKKMMVLGQFNLGFILAKIGDDIFIIDQHASDEKYNFERLSKTTVLNRQPLLSPLGLDLSAAEEMTVISHIETFRKNGFDFVEDQNAPAGHRLKLSAVPFSQNITFGVGDVQELISLLADEPVISTPHKASSWLPRPSRVRAMLASRACRSSVMIGDPLSKKEMERILSHLAELDAPWNCPHGRPTMRHLLDLSSVQKGDASSKRGTYRGKRF